MNNIQILVTGGCGFIGLNLIEYLINKTDWDINVLDNLSVGRLKDLEQLPNYLNNRISFIKGDICNSQDVSKAIKDCEKVVHLAAQTDIMKSIKDPYFDAEINVLGTVNILQQAKKQDISCFIQASSAAPLGEQTPPVDETKIPRPLSGYGASKLSCEGYCSAFAGSYDMNTIALRFSNVYGPYSFQKGSVVAKFIKDILQDKPPIIFGDGNQTRDFIHAGDIAQAIYLSLTKNLSEKFSLFQIGTGVETKINSLYEMIASLLEKKNITASKPVYKSERSGEIYRNYCDISNACRNLGFKPVFSLKKGLEDTIDWFISQKKEVVVG